MPATATAHNPTMTKKEVCEYLGKSTRSVAEYMAQGKLTPRYVSGPNGRQAVFDHAAVAQLKTEMETPLTRSTPQLAASWAGPAAVETAGSFAEAFAAALRTALQSGTPNDPPKPAPFLNLDAAAAYSGLPARLLHRFIREKALPAVRFSGAWYVKQRDLDDLQLPVHTEAVSPARARE